MAKSVLDAGWAGLKHMSSYKTLMRGGMGLEANEACGRSFLMRGGGFEAPPFRAGSSHTYCFVIDHPSCFVIDHQRERAAT